MAQFSGLKEDMFAVYVPEKWSSNVHTLTRMRNKDALVALCGEIQSALGSDLTDLTRQASDEFPNIGNNKRVEAQWVYWFRDAASRQSLASFLERTPLDEKTIFNIAPQDKHAIVAVKMDQGGLWAGLRLAEGATIDRRNLMAKLSQSWERERALAIVRALPEAVLVQLGDTQRPGVEFDDDAARGLATNLTPGGGTLSVGVFLDRTQALAMGPALLPHLTEVLRALLPLYRFLAWTRDNDLIEVSKQLQAEKAQRRRSDARFAQGDKVRFVAGLWSGKTGVVQGVDAKAQVRVQVGKMSVTVGGADLTAQA